VLAAELQLLLLRSVVELAVVRQVLLAVVAERLLHVEGGRLSGQELQPLPQLLEARVGHSEALCLFR
jgi:hypothetical protein